MQTTADELDLAPPPPRWDARAWLLALLAHALLIAALAWGIGWQRDNPATVSAELWASVPRSAAARAQEPQVTPPPAPAVAPFPPPPRPAPTPEATPPARAADIALQRQREEQRRREEEALRQAQQRAEQEKAEAQRRAREKAAQDRAAHEKAEREARQQAERQRQQRERELQAQLEAERQRNLERILGQAGATGGAQARGTDAQDAGPSASYAGRVVAAIRPNIVFTDSIPGNPRAEVEVRTLPDGTILGSRLLRSSGHRAWDEAVLRAVERTGRLPRDERGRVPPTLILGFRPQE